jgi:hypothetical protein
MTKTYRGHRAADGHVVVQRSDGDGPPWKALPHVAFHSPTGFEWGYGGSGPADLSLSLLCDALGVAPSSMRSYAKGSIRDFPVERYVSCHAVYGMHQRFKFEVVAKLDHNQWELTQDKISSWSLRASAQDRDQEHSEDER